MINEEIIDGNVLIANFMFPDLQKEIDDGNVILDGNLWVKATMISKDYSMLKYHCDWNWLMEVVDKIESIEDRNLAVKLENGGSWGQNLFSIVIASNTANICGDAGYTKYDEFKTNGGSSKIEAVWLTVIDFIDWYNFNKNYEG